MASGGVFQGLEIWRGLFSKLWKISRISFPRLGKTGVMVFQGLEMARLNLPAWA
jgi:hypothetical protein